MAASAVLFASAFLLFANASPAQDAYDAPYIKNVRGVFEYVQMYGYPVPADIAKQTMSFSVPHSPACPVYSGIQVATIGAGEVSILTLDFFGAISAEGGDADAVAKIQLVAYANGKFAGEFIGGRTIALYAEPSREALTALLRGCVSSIADTLH